MGFDVSKLATVQLVPLAPFSPDGSTLVPEVLTAFSTRGYGSSCREPERASFNR